MASNKIEDFFQDCIIFGNVWYYSIGQWSTLKLLRLCEISRAVLCLQPLQPESHSERCAALPQYRGPPSSDVTTST